jgi:hypothetical protein
LLPVPLQFSPARDWMPARNGRLPRGPRRVDQGALHSDQCTFDVTSGPFDSGKGCLPEAMIIDR